MRHQSLQRRCRSVGIGIRVLVGLYSIGMSLLAPHCSLLSPRSPRGGMCTDPLVEQGDSGVVVHSAWFGGGELQSSFP